MRSFNSLPTGKPIQRGRVRNSSNSQDTSFQFPSNGKAYPKRGQRMNTTYKCWEFQFPSNGKAYPKEGIITFVSYFISVSIPFQRESLSKVNLDEYNENLLNGKVSIPFQRESLSKGTWAQPIHIHTHVSIPFQRESLSKVKWFLSWELCDKLFQFPSNGKAYPKKEQRFASRADRLSGFQFPSNGKAYPKQNP